MLKRLILWFFLWIFCVTPVFAQKIQDLRLSASNNQTMRFVVDLSDQAEIKLSRLASPPRLVIDVQNATFDPTVLAKQFSKIGFISSIRLGTPAPNTSRIVLDLQSDNISEKHFTLAPQASATWRFVIDLTNETPQVGIKPFSNDAQTVATQAPAQTSSKKSVARKKIVMLDPGHGGQDPGAISRSGKYEKDLTLKMAKETKTLLEKAGYKVVMTRDKDYYVTLRGRIEKAHKANADLFISIHADSAKSSAAKGLSVYTISETASDKEAAALAESANKADILFGMDLSEYQPEVGNILIDFAKTYTMDQSAKYADEVVKEMAKEVTLRPKAHRYAGFAVLKSPNVPSVLLEMGYLSNKEEDKLLQKESYRNKLSKALVRAVNTYFTKHVEQ